MSTYFLLFIEFFKTGLFAVGGGLATIPFLTDMQLRYPAWFSNATVADIVAVAESTPGPIGVNAATYAGYSAAGIPGALIATASLVLPSLIVITIISGFFEKYRSSEIVNAAFTGVRPVVAGLIAAAGWTMMQLSVFPGEGPLFSRFDWRCGLLFVVLFTALQLKKTKKLHPIFYVLAGAVCGLVFGF